MQTTEHCRYMLLALLALIVVTSGGCAEQQPWPIFEKPPLIEPGVGVGPIRFGMKQGEVFARLGKIRSTHSASSGRGYGNDLPRVESLGFGYEGRHLDLHIFTYPDAGVQEMSLAVYRDFARLPWHKTPRTANGIGLGSTKAQLLAAFGEPTRTIGDFPSGLSIFEYAHLGMSFHVEKPGVITYISMHRPALGMDDVPEALAKEYENAE